VPVLPLPAPPAVAHANPTAPPTPAGVAARAPTSAAEAAAAPTSAAEAARAATPAPPPVPAVPAPTPPAVEVAAKSAALKPAAPKPAARPPELGSPATVPPPPSIAVSVEKTQWHPAADRRIAWLRVPGETEPHRVVEGDIVDGLLVAAIEPSGVVFEREGEKIRRLIGKP
jgi:hypothetical protein